MIAAPASNNAMNNNISYVSIRKTLVDRVREPILECKNEQNSLHTMNEWDE